MRTQKAKAKHQCIKYERERTKIPKTNIGTYQRTPWDCNGKSIDLGANSVSPNKCGGGNEPKQTCTGTKGIASISGIVSVYTDNYDNPVVDISNGSILVRGLHWDSIAVSDGDYINQGDYIGEIGDKGNATFKHLHFEVFDSGVKQTYVKWAFSNCSPPSTGNWTVSSSCEVGNSATVHGNILIPNGVTLVIPNDVVLNVDFINHKLEVKNGGSIVIKNGGRLD